MYIDIDSAIELERQLLTVLDGLPKGKTIAKWQR